MHGASPLTLNNELNGLAQQWANQLATKIRGLVHSKQPYKNQYLGENLATMWDSNGLASTK